MQARYPHMSPLDARVWRRFLILHPLKFRALTYDVTVGTGAFAWDVPDINPPSEWLALAAKRIDVVGKWADEIAIIEVKPRASMSALGQVLSYIDLYRQKEKPSQRVSGWVVCEHRDEDLVPTFVRFGIGVVAVGLS